MDAPISNLHWECNMFTTKERVRLCKLNAIKKSVDRVIEFGLQIIKQSTTDDLRLLINRLEAERQQLCRKIT